MNADRISVVRPLVISASRATDIPAFHFEWLINRLKAGHCLWQNPFNAAQKQRVSFERARAIVFWSKNPAPLMPFLPEISALGYQFYFQFTLNNYEGTGLEPRLPSLAQRIETFKRLSDQIGPERVIWRYDPIILGTGLYIQNTLERIEAIGREIAPYTEKLVFSFVDMYQKTQRELRSLAPTLSAPTREEALLLAKGISDVARTLPGRLHLATCAEDLELEDLGIDHNRCIDPDLLRHLCPDCAEFQTASASSVPQGTQASLPGMPLQAVNTRSAKDKGQRKACGCVPSKDIGAYSTCFHLCAYCYANKSRERIWANMRGIDPHSEALG